ncbi:hypothetical protein C7S16_1782 [Burkholderia thailandensis]|uniref:Uncharacterized protein n=1 Tax=Burkholderia thailandensis TaxID=57975 RepID=A0AAW9D4B2_BURTH|nr:hypothetical protein [Burkholderia thailandensis]MDW9256644.1 hypothetical protein [Burkholderia thailandensis]
MDRCADGNRRMRSESDIGVIIGNGDHPNAVMARRATDIAASA